MRLRSMQQIAKQLQLCQGYSRQFYQLGQSQDLFPTENSKVRTQNCMVFFLKIPLQ